MGSPVHFTDCEVKPRNHNEHLPWPTNNPLHLHFHLLLHKVHLLHHNLARRLCTHFTPSCIFAQARRVPLRSLSQRNPVFLVLYHRYHTPTRLCSLKKDTVWLYNVCNRPSLPGPRYISIRAKYQCSRTPDDAASSHTPRICPSHPPATCSRRLSSAYSLILLAESVLIFVSFEHLSSTPHSVP